METSQITLIMTSVTAIAAIIGPVVSSVVAARSAQKIKTTELYMPRSFDALGNMAECYTQLSRFDESIDSGKNRVVDISVYRKFAVACYKVIPLIRKRHLRKQITDLLSTIEDNHRCTNDLIDATFDAVILDLAKAIRV